MTSFNHYDEFEQHHLKAAALLSLLGNQSETNEVNPHAVNSVAQQISEHVAAMADSMEAVRQAVDPVTGKLTVVSSA